MRRQRIFIFEGADGTGKTTALASLSAQLTKMSIPHSTLHFGPPAPNTVWEEFYRDGPLETARKSGVLLMDRSFISHVVYTTVTGERPLFSLRDLRLMANEFATMDTVATFFERPRSSIEATLRARGEVDQLQHIDSLRREYYAIRHWLMVNTSLNLRTRRIR